MAEKSVWRRLVESIVAPPADQGGHTEVSSLEERLLDQSIQNRRDLALKGIHIKPDQIITDMVRQNIEAGKLKVEDGKIVPNQ